VIVWAVEAMEVCTGRGSDIYVHCIILIKASQAKEIVETVNVFWWFLSSFSPICLCSYEMQYSYILIRTSYCRNMCHLKDSLKHTAILTDNF
jgi:hypothetical protein